MIVWSHTTFLSLPFLPFSSPLFSLLGIEIPTGSELDRFPGFHSLWGPSHATEFYDRLDWKQLVGDGLLLHVRRSTSSEVAVICQCSC